MLLLLFPGLVSAQVVVSEIMYNAPGSDSKSEWIELQNVSTEAIDIAKWKISDGSNHAFNAPPKNGSTGTLVLPPGGYLILASDAETFLSTHTVSASVIDTVLSLGNDKSSIALLDAAGTTIDKVSYSPSKGADGNGDALQKINGTWKASAPTPGEANVYVPKTKASAPKTTTPKTAAKSSTKKVAQKPNPQILEGTSTVSAEIRAQGDPTASQFASAVVPLGSSDSGILPWIYGLLAIAVSGAGAVFVARQKKSGEWDIEEIA